MARREVHHGYDLSPDEFRRRIPVGDARRRPQNAEFWSEVDGQTDGGNACLRKVVRLDDAPHPQVDPFEFRGAQRLLHGSRDSTFRC